MLCPTILRFTWNNTTAISSERGTHLIKCLEDDNKFCYDADTDIINYIL